MRIYVDAVMGINFLVDLLLLAGTSRLAGYPCRMGRLSAAAALGAVYSGACLVPGFRFLGNTLWRVVTLGLMGGIAFGWERSAVRRCGVFLLLSLALGGFAVCLGRTDIPVLIFSAGGLWLLCRFAFASPPGSREYVPLEIRHGENVVKLLALRDTGNTLRDPITGEQALVISAEAASRLTGLTREQIASPLATMASGAVPGLRLLPYRAVGQGSGMLLAMRFENVTIGNRKQGALVAFAAEGFSRTQPYQALTGGTLG